MCDLVKAVLFGGEKAGRVARACRTVPALAELLVQQKHSDEANPRFCADFKTLADVLIQETLRHDLSLKFPALTNHIHGEEVNRFSNTLGETITVEVKQTESETADLLCQVLDGDRNIAQLLAAEVHGDVEVDNLNCQISSCLNLDICVKDLAIWIDPIDSTAEYINGDTDASKVGSISLSGLQCVTVLIGVYDRITGQPIIGVVNQPFYDGTKGRSLWGINYMGKRIFCNPIKEPTMNGDSAAKSTICISSSEDENLKQLLTNAGYNLVESAGAGYKLLMVILGYADAYILSKPTTFKWDTCGPHAILNSLKGAIVDYSKVLNEVDENENIEITYDIDPNNHTARCNRGGIIAYRNADAVSKILQILSSAN